MKFVVLVGQNGNREQVNGVTAKNKNEAMSNAETLVKGSRTVSVLKVK